MLEYNESTDLDQVRDQVDTWAIENGLSYEEQGNEITVEGGLTVEVDGSDVNVEHQGQLNSAYEASLRSHLE